jgi:hypothetical protein
VKKRHDYNIHAISAMTPYSTCTEVELLKIRDFLLSQMSGGVFTSANVPGLSWTMRVESREEAETTLLLIGEELYNQNPTRYPRARRIKLTVMRAAFDDRVNRSND